MQLFAKGTKDTKKKKERAKITQDLPKSLEMPLYKGTSGREVLV